MNRKKLLVAGLCLLLSAVMLLSGSLAWLSKSRSSSGAFTALSDFELEGVLSFGGQTYTGTSILAEVSFRPGDANYIGKMKYVVNYSGISPAYIRVRILEQWTDINSNEISPSSFLTYALAPDGNAISPSLPEGSLTIPAAGPDSGALAEVGQWVDNRSTDYCYYYNVPVQPKALLNTGTKDSPAIADGSVSLTLIDQNGDATLIDGINPDTTSMGLIIEVEAVQPNRYREFWGITALPF